MEIKNLKLKIKKLLGRFTNFYRALFFCLIYLNFAFYILNFSGCATVPARESNIPIYNLNGTRYIPLLSLCEARKIEWDYDTFTKTVTLKNDSQQVILAVGSSIAIVNGTPRDIKFPVDIRDGAVVAPYRFKGEILDVLFKEPSRQEAGVQAIGTLKRIVIDAGHGGRDSGAVGRLGLKEKDAVLDICRRLASILEGVGYDVILTRNSDAFMSLALRSCIANKEHADLFISIHANANRVRGLSGFEVYYLSNEVNDADRALLAAENTDLEPNGTCLAAESLDLKATVWDMIYTSNRAESIDLARYICSEARLTLPTRIIGSKGAPFYVLKTTQMPSVLVEVGFVSNLKEEKMLKSGFYRQEIAETIARAFKKYCQDYALIEAKAK